MENRYVKEKEINNMFNNGDCIGAVGFGKETGFIYLKLKPDDEVIDLELGRNEAKILADAIYDALSDSERFAKESKR